MPQKVANGVLVSTVQNLSNGTTKGTNTGSINGDTSTKNVSNDINNMHSTDENGAHQYLNTKSTDSTECGSVNKYTYEIIEQIANYLKERIPFKPNVGIICGSGMGSIADALADPIVFPYDTIPNFPVSTVAGHVGRLVFGCMSGIPVVCMQGRFHYYEGYPLWMCAMPVRVMKLLGTTHLIASNAAGGLNPNFKVGDIMVVRDHINLMGFAGNNPLQGPNEERFGPRFPPMNQAYDKTMSAYARQIAVDLNIAHLMHEGVYTCLGGPNFETPAELRMLKMWGADAIGMSTVHEVIMARHCDMTVFAFSLITNVGITDYQCTEKPCHAEVMDVGKQREALLKKFVDKLVEYVADDINNNNTTTTMMLNDKDTTN